MGPSEDLAARIRKAVADAVRDAGGPTHVAAAAQEGTDGAVVSATSSQHVAIVQHRGRTWVSRGPSPDAPESAEDDENTASE